MYVWFAHIRKSKTPSRLLVKKLHPDYWKKTPPRLLVKNSIQIIGKKLHPDYW
jgi:hypothetical protein